VFFLKGAFAGIASAAIVLILAAYIIGGTGLLLEGLHISKNSAMAAAPMLLVSFIVIGQLRVLISKEMLNKWLQNNKGIKGILVSALTGGLFPGGPYVYYPFIASFVEKEVPFSIFAAFIVGKQVYDFARIPMEMSFLGPGVTLIRNIITFPVPIIIGFLAKNINPEKLGGAFFTKEGGKL
jgi:uncharacterized membrane protein YraQ (UPF0718 family)